MFHSCKFSNFIIFRYCNWNGICLKGIAFGSAAASIQSGIGNVVAGSMFATMTSLGMTAVLSTLCIGCGVLAIGGLCYIYRNEIKSFFNRFF